MGPCGHVQKPSPSYVTEPAYCCHCCLLTMLSPQTSKWSAKLSQCRNFAGAIRPASSMGLWLPRLLGQAREIRRGNKFCNLGDCSDLHCYFFIGCLCWLDSSYLLLISLFLLFFPPKRIRFPWQLPPPQPSNLSWLQKSCFYPVFIKEKGYSSFYAIHKFGKI